MGGWSFGIVVKSSMLHFSGLGSQVQILGTDLQTGHQAMLWQCPTYKMEEDWHRY